ncbi:hypothetical protein AC477_02015 [miscellaneous Crenarchaeota group-1 archaeon SG8-32-1]|uniref:Glycosyltransferase subfamily 4-like N-terminal domain-containing protein n=1 Tax=miscellaneous Crenarchaeota group-1 archaeon SG8-32-1 TaxID=1685124 RepID=A0A0M0BY71_9ARCH|nr:MAG: hypothetical protein AC477_02015 [miscellaneous Crenarchaeota group-1 archaeon SG8-32-1]
MLNFLILSELYYPHVGGAEYATYLYAKLLSKAGFEVTVITNRFGNEPAVSRDDNVTVYRLPLFKSISGFKYSVLLRVDALFSGFMRKMIKKADVVYIPRFWFAGGLIAKALGKPVIIHLHDYIPSCSLAILYDISKRAICESGSACSMRCVYSSEKLKGNSLLWTMESVFLNSTIGRYLGKLVGLADVIICVSKLQREKVVGNNPTLLNKTLVIYNPLPEVSFSPVQGNSYGYFGGMNYIKGFLTLYGATRLASQEFLIKPKIHVTNFPFKMKLKKSLSNLGFIVHERVEREIFEKIYSNVSTTIVPSLWHEPWPYVVVEALIKGRYLIASKVGGIPEQVEKCKGVALCEPGDIRQLAEAMSLVNDLSRETIVDWGAKNREIFLQRFNNETSIRNLIKVCEQVN